MVLAQQLQEAQEGGHAPHLQRVHHIGGNKV